MKHLASKTTRSKLSSYTEDQIQPNAIDLRISKAYKIFNSNLFYLSDKDKVHRGSVEIEPIDGCFRFEAGSYEIVMEGIIEIGENEAGWVITRSTLNRNGCFITSGLYDSGYKGVMAGVLHVSGPAYIEVGTRVGQMLIFDAETLKMYDGSYGIGKEHDKKYN